MIEEPQEPPEREPRAGVTQERLDAWCPEYFVLRAAHDWIVSKETARYVERVLRRLIRPRWIRFVDITGAAIRLQVRDIYYLKQSTPDTRELWRRFKKERHSESIADVPDYDIDF